MCLSQWQGLRRYLSASLGSVVDQGTFKKSLLEMGISVLCLFL